MSDRHLNADLYLGICFDDKAETMMGEGVGIFYRYFFLWKLAIKKGYLLATNNLSRSMLLIKLMLLRTSNFFDCH
ncbi:hypothetical protein [Myxosarcina sp. GI1]|uniref:hypothetical protein n=1 Tax=Myxosarcina sp. GI1 TaxID=1541065 RepID=UPI0012E01C45|nr:hypothetical protein [Myxosarcina sp. GI1]